MIIRHGLLAVIGICLIGCASSRPPRTCDEVLGRGLPQILERADPPRETRIRIADAYAFALDQVMQHVNPRTTELVWSKDGIDGVLQFEGTRFVGGGLHYNERSPSADTVIACLGAPDYYSSVYRPAPPGAPGNVLVFEVYFLRHGIGASYFVYQRGKQPPRVTGAISLNDFGFVSVGSAQETMDRLSLNMTAKERERLRPWPGGWQSLETTIDPDSPPQ